MSGSSLSTFILKIGVSLKYFRCLLTFFNINAINSIAMKKMFLKYRRYLAILAFVLICAGVALKFYEKTRPATDYFEYYGNVTTKTEYRYPEKIESYAFGENTGSVEPDILFENQLYCRPFDSDKESLISIHAVLAPDYKYWNELDVALMSRSLIDGERKQLISERLEDRLRREGNEGLYGTWGLNNTMPVEDGICHIISLGTIKTPIFGYEKTVASDGTSFTYYAKDDKKDPD